MLGELLLPERLIHDAGIHFLRRKWTVTSLQSALLGLALLGCARSVSAQNAYITNQTNNNVSVINTATNTVIATVPVGKMPYGVAVNPAGTFAYVTNELSNNVSVINTATNTVAATVPVGNFPIGIAVNPAGTFAYVVNSSSNPGTVSVINTSTNTVVATVPVGLDPWGVAVNPAGTFAYVTNSYDGTVSVINTATNSVTATVPVIGGVNGGNNVLGVAVNPAGTFVYVASGPAEVVGPPAYSVGRNVAVINTATNTVTARVPVDAPGGSNPFGVAVNPAGTFVYVSNSLGNGTVSVINTATNTLTATVPVGEVEPAGVALNPAGTFAYVANLGAGGTNSGTVSVINTATNTVVATVPVGGEPIAFGQFIQPATMFLSQTAINFGIGGGVITDPQNVTVSFNGGAKLNWTTSSNQPNVVVSPTSGTGTGTLTITASAGPSATITVTPAGVASSSQTITVNIANVTPGVPFGSFDTPVTTGNPTSAGAIAATGWALDAIEVTGVDIWREPVTGESGSALIFIGNATFVPGARPDVQADYPSYPLNYRAGWGLQILTNELPNSAGSGPIGNGTFNIHAIAHNKTGSQTDLGTKTITVNNAAATSPFGTIDTPTQGQTVSGTVVNFGWALTPPTVGCPGVDQPCIIPVNGSTLVVYIDSNPVANPVYNFARCDVDQDFPNYANSGSTNCANNGTSPGPVGFYTLDTTQLTNGLHTIQWSVTDNAGRVTGIGSRFFTVLN